MAILWQKKIDGNLYQVRTAGQRKRLFTNGVCHSEYNPERITTGSIWDLLTLPAFFHSPNDTKRVLLLGVGGGSVIRQMLALLDIEEITGVELNPTHLYVARRFFELDRPEVRLVEADAMEWVRQYRGPAFDMIIEDLFVERKNEPVRALDADFRWLERLAGILSRNGKLIMNFVSAADLKASAYFTDKKISKQFLSAYQLTTPDLDNYVGVFLRGEGDNKTLRKNLMATGQFRKALENKSLTYRIRRLHCLN